MDASFKTPLMGALGLAITAWVAGCELSVNGASCPCAPGWICLEDGDEDQGVAGDPGVCVRPYCVFRTDIDRPGGIDVELSGDLVVVTGYTTTVPRGGDILVTSGATLSAPVESRRIFVEPHGAVFNIGIRNQIYLRDRAIYRTVSDAYNEIFHEPGARVGFIGPGTTMREHGAIDFLGEVEVPFAVTFREIYGYHADPTERGIADYVVRNGGHLATTARADNLFVETYGWVLRIDYGHVIYVQSDGYFHAGDKRQIIHHVPGARIADAPEESLIEHATLELDACTR